MMVHMDGARLANAAVSLDKNLREVTRDAGIDVLSFGGTKNGLMYGEAILFFNGNAREEFKYIRKQGMQLASKMRFISAQFLRYLSDNLWCKTARQANSMAKLLAEETGKIPGIEITQQVEANGVFAKLPPEIIPRLQEEFAFYVWDQERSIVRWMTSFDTTEGDIYEFVDLIKQVI
jgi:threonine aldolase